MITPIQDTCDWSAVYYMYYDHSYTVIDVYSTIKWSPQSGPSIEEVYVYSTNDRSPTAYKHPKPAAII